MRRMLFRDLSDFRLRMAPDRFRKGAGRVADLTGILVEMGVIAQSPGVALQSFILSVVFGELRGPRMWSGVSGGAASPAFSLTA